MARPATTTDVIERSIEVGTIEIDQFVTTPTVLKTWAAFVESIAKSGGDLRHSPYSRGKVEIWMPRDEAQLKDQLRQEQYRWDENQKKYDICAINHTPPENWCKETVKAWAVAEGLPVIWEVEREVADDAQLAALRAKLAGN